MSGCRINTNLKSGSGYEKDKDTDSKQSKEIDAKLAEMIALREKQDKALVDTTEVLTDKEYEAKWGKQPNSTDGKKQ